MVGQAVRHADHVAEAALQLSGASVQGSSSAQHITDEVREIMERSEEQVLSVNRGAESLNDLTQTVCEVMEVSHHAREASAAALTDSEAGREAIARVTGQMNAMHATMGRLTDAVTRLSDRTEQIEKANQLIAGIANQTNILALNAGIEAVQAGAGGKGFSVIAGEVRKLAGQTSAAAAEIAHIAAGVKEEALGMAQATRRGAAETAEGLDAARHAGEAFGRIRESVTEAAGRIRHAVDCSERAGSRTREAAEQIRSIEQAAAGVTEGARKVGAGAEEQYAGMEEISASAEMLSRMADELRSLIQRFRT
ncbi:methyl-accepting chemotaxis protein [Paenibacillus sp. P26]|nr:methyl-accepting chemotaxis protein [Paenibacillus sp. P26]